MLQLHLQKLVTLSCWASGFRVSGVLGKPTSQLACVPRWLGNGLLCCQACDGGSGVPLGTGGASAATWGQERDSILRASALGSRLVPSPLEEAASPTGLGWTASGHRCHLCCFRRGPRRTAMWRGRPCAKPTHQLHCGSHKPSGQRLAGFHRRASSLLGN